MAFTFRRRFFSFLALAASLTLSLSACDMADPNDGGNGNGGGNNGGDVPMATVTVDLQSITAVNDCENDDTNPGEFQFKVAFTDDRNQSLGNDIELPAGAYGSSGDDNIQLLDGESMVVNQDVSFTLPEQTGSAFTIAMSMTEWDFGTTPDGDADDVSGFSTYEFADGRFQGIAGPQTLNVDGGDVSRCQTQLKYMITID